MCCLSLVAIVRGKSVGSALFLRINFSITSGALISDQRQRSIIVLMQTYPSPFEVALLFLWRHSTSKRQLREEASRSVEVGQTRMTQTTKGYGRRGTQEIDRFDLRAKLRLTTRCRMDQVQHEYFPSANSTRRAVYAEGRSR